LIMQKLLRMDEENFLVKSIFCIKFYKN